MSNSNQLNEILKYLAQFHPMAGTIEMYAGQEAPTGWLVCDGSAISRTEYSKLFEVIGLTYGAGDGSTTFNLPDMRGRTPIGVGTGVYTGATAHALGVTGGAETHTLTLAQLPSISGYFNIRKWGTGDLIIGASGKMSYTSYSTSATSCDAYSSNPNSAQRVTMSFGSGQTHNNMQPYIAITYIISTGLIEYPEIEQEENNG